jgi:secondary thiamine-phosphate synthase enzyme
VTSFNVELMKEINIRTNLREEMIDITGLVQTIISENKFISGICVVFTPHTTAAVTINENSDPAVPLDVIHALEKTLPANFQYRHAEGNSPAHLKSSLVGVSELVLVENGRLVLGTWQAIFFCEFDGPRPRKIIVKFIPHG